MSNITDFLSVGVIVSIFVCLYTCQFVIPINPKNMFNRYLELNIKVNEEFFGSKKLLASFIPGVFFGMFR